MSDPATAGLAFSVIGGGISMFGQQNAQDDAKADDAAAIAENKKQAKEERRRQQFAKLQEDRKLIREQTQREADARTAGITQGVSQGSSAITGAAQTVAGESAVGQGFATANLASFNRIQDSKIAEAQHISNRNDALAQGQAFASIGSSVQSFGGQLTSVGGSKQGQLAFGQFGGGFKKDFSIFG